jgi:hypothetical protein
VESLLPTPDRPATAADTAPWEAWSSADSTGQRTRPSRRARQRWQRATGSAADRCSARVAAEASGQPVQQWCVRWCVVGQRDLAAEAMPAGLPAAVGHAYIDLIPGEAERGGC